MPDTAVNASAQESNHHPILRLPILVGITGKRNLGDKVDSIRQRLTQTFQRLDVDFPRVPKVLLTGGADGADLIAAEVLTRVDAQGRGGFPDWSVVVLLPFEQNLFEKDFRSQDGPDSSAAHAVADSATEGMVRLRNLLASPRVLRRVLPPLRNPGGDTTQSAALDRDTPHAEPILRHNHYEQVGQFIAGAATIMIAAMDGNEIANTSEADGGTARVVACRRAGRPDARGIEVARRSSVLRSDWNALADPPAGYVWLIEPNRELEQRDRPRGYPVLILPPVENAYAQAPSAQVAEPHTAGSRRHSLRGRRQESRRRLDASLAIPKAFDRFYFATNRTSRRKSKDQHSSERSLNWFSSMTTALRRHAGMPLPPLNLAPTCSPPEAIAQVRRTISSVQVEANASSRRAFQAIAILFVLAVLTLEVYAKFTPTEPLVLGFYLVLLATIFLVIILTRWRRLQPLSEDYRAVNEMLRVQRAWWSAGLPLRVDHVHMQSVDAELARIRDAVRAILEWIWLRSSWASARPEAKDWARVRGREQNARTTEVLRELAGPPADWIGGQIWYFAKNHRRSYRTVRRLDAFTWSLFAASGWLALLLCIWLGWHDSRDLFVAVAEQVGWLPGSAASASGLVLWMALGAGALWFLSWRAGQEDPEAPAGKGAQQLMTLMVALVGLVAAIAFALAIQCGAILLSGSGQEAAVMTNAKKLTFVVFITLTAMAGAVRYVSERLNFAAQALEYRDALRRFEHAERLLASGTDPHSGAPTDEVFAQRIVEDLGLLALRENEAWLKARRERPLSPVLG